jgi:hypothetical protein
MNLLHNMSCPPRTEVVLQGRPVSPQVVIFDLAVALLDAGYLKQEHFTGNNRDFADVMTVHAAAREAVHRRWRTPQALFALIGAPQYPDVTSDFLIGWRPQLQHYYSLSPLYCVNPRLCAGVLARCAGTLYLSRRQSDLTWERLLDAPLAFDDPSPIFSESLAPTKRWKWAELVYIFSGSRLLIG